jgi:hypothetical protein
MEQLPPINVNTAKTVAYITLAVLMTVYAWHFLWRQTG